jgi:hypothetical protein
VPGRALEQITILTQFLVYKLEAMLPATQVRIAAIRSPNKKLDTVAAQLTEQIKLEMTQHPGFQVSDAPETTVVIEGDLSRRTGGFLDANVRIRWGEDVKPDCRRYRKDERYQRVGRLQAHRQPRWRSGLLVQRGIHPRRGRYGKTC